VTRPAVSAIIPTHNRAPLLAEALDSVLAQAGEDVEVIVVDDGSTDETPRALARHAGRVRTIRQANAGVGAARNRGVAAARGGMIAFLDDDDLWAPDHLAVLRGALEASPGAMMACGRTACFRDPPRPEPPPSVEGYVAGAILARREVFARVGPFREELSFGDFIDWMARVREAGIGIVTTPEVVLRRRLHAANFTLTERQHLGDYARVARAALARRRAAARAGEDGGAG
jgi:glycosyltransferase involved in cell wall biosynthesis